MQPFSLSKWYADCVSDEGEAVLCYSFELVWGPARVRYQGVTEVGHGDWPARRKSAPGLLTYPRADDHRYRWNSPKLGLTGVWRPKYYSLARRPFESEEGSVYLTCLTPGAVAEVAFADGRKVRGCGYVERLDITMPPWQLPVQELRWGRVVTQDHALHWCDWTGPYRTSFLYVDGVDDAPEQIADDRVRSRSTSLDLGSPRVIREGTLAEMGLADVPTLEALLPAAALDIVSEMWISEARLRIAGTPESVGWAIHQRISWPKAR